MKLTKQQKTNDELTLLGTLIYDWNNENRLEWSSLIRKNVVKMFSPSWHKSQYIVNKLDKLDTIFYNLDILGYTKHLWIMDGGSVKKHVLIIDVILKVESGTWRIYSRVIEVRDLDFLTPFGFVWIQLAKEIEIGNYE